MSKKQFYSIGLLICLFVLFTSIPFDLWITNETVVYVLQMILKIGFLILAIFYIKKEGYRYEWSGKLQWKHSILLPFLLLCFSNLVVCLIQSSPMKDIQDYHGIVMDFFFYLLVAVSEELVFRYVLFQELQTHQGKLKAMLISSMIFGGLHLLNINSLASIPTCLVQSLYTFGLGMVLSLVYMDTKNLSVTILFHFLFNFMNDSLVSNLFDMEWDVAFYVINSIFAVVFLVYGGMIYLCKIRKEKEDVTEYLDH